jgi:hypothetical protein
MPLAGFFLSHVDAFPAIYGEDTGGLDMGARGQLGVMIPEGFLFLPLQASKSGRDFFYA